MNAHPLDARIQHPVTYPFVRCPACGSARLDAVVEDVEGGTTAQHKAAGRKGGKATAKKS